MKKILFYLLALLSFGCAKSDDSFFSEDALQPIVNKDGIEVFIKKGAPFRTRGDVDAEFITLYTKEKDDGFVLVNERVCLEDGLTISRDYTSDAVLLATYTFLDDKLIDIELSPEVLEPITQASDWYNRKGGESYRDCAKRVYREAKVNARKDLVNEMFCDFTSALCPSICAFLAIVGCAY